MMIHVVEEDGHIWDGYLPHEDKCVMCRKAVYTL